MSCVIGLSLPCYICLIELLAALLSYCLWLFVFSWFKSRRESIDLGIFPLLSYQAFFVSALSFPTLITAASSGVGHYVVQLAKFGDVTCGACNIEFVKSFGADEVVDYKTPEGATLKSPSGNSMM